MTHYGRSTAGDPREQVMGGTNRPGTVMPAHRLVTARLWGVVERTAAASPPGRRCPAAGLWSVGC